MNQVPLRIEAHDRSIREILDKKKYTVDFFQREFNWEKKHIEQLIADLESRFLQDYNKGHERTQVRYYSRYFLGPIVLSDKKGQLSIIDGQQRLTSLSLLLIHLHNLQEGRSDKVNIKNLIFSEKYSRKSFNLDVGDRVECMESLFKGQSYSPKGKNESVKNIVERYNDIVELFPDDLAGDALPFFVDWLIENVILVEIVTYSDEDGYFIFETMNDRGLNLTSTEMLKGYLLSNIRDEDKKHEINEHWRKSVSRLTEIEKDKDLHFFKTWLRAKYAKTIRRGRKGAANEDFEKIGTRFHSWVRDNKSQIGLRKGDDFYNFVRDNMNFFFQVYLKISEAEEELVESLKHVYYVNEKGFTLHYPILLAPIEIEDDEETTNRKLNLIARFIETFIVYRSVNCRTLAYSSIRYTMFSLARKVRDKSVQELVPILKQELEDMDEDLDGIEEFRLHGQNKHFVHFLLARITQHIEEMSKVNSTFEGYVDRSLDEPYQVEHIWADDYDRFRSDFPQRDEWEEYRNMIGGLLLLPEDFNKSYGDLDYERKLPHYYGQNLLAKSLSPNCYQRNPSFLRYRTKSGLPFRPHEEFSKDDLLERQQLYREICEEIWSLDGFDRIAQS